MRPLRLALAGFATFRDPIEVSFEGTDLLAFVGPTGSGKSTLIDGIVFALYGCVTRYDDARAVAPVLHQLSNEARVRLDFELRGRHYTAVRVVRRTGAGATTKEARLEEVAADGTVHTLASGVRELDPAVHALLGLDVEQFNRTVVLPQGQFATFLHGKKEDRQQLLRQLLDTGIYQRMGQRARARAKEHEARRTVLAEQLDKLDAVDDDALAALAARRDALVALGAWVTAQVDDVRRLRDEAHGHRAAAVGAQAVADALAALVLPDAVQALGPRLAEADAAVTAADTALASARTARDEAKAALDAGPDPVALHRAIDALARLAELDAELAEAGPAAEQAELALDAAQADVERAEGEADAATARLMDAERLAGLGAVVAELVVGEACPVCRQTVSALPDHDVDAELAAAKKAKAAADKALASARKVASGAAKESATRTGRATAVMAERERVVASVPVGVTAEELAAQAGEAASAKAASDAAAVACTEAEQAAERASRARQELAAEEGRWRDGFVAARDRVASRQPPAPQGASLQADWEALVAWGAGEAVVVGEELAELQRLAGEAEAAERAIVEAVVARAGDVGIAVGDVARAGEQVASAATDATLRVEQAEARRAEAAALTAEIAELAEQVGLDTEMGRLLDISGFERWLLQAALDDLVARATRRLFDLSGGQYSLESADGEFSIRDHRNADELRGVRTLSGGETFLASLALALALSESIADLAVEGGPRIESMFLDEGFGTLDPDSLDLVATSLEELSASGRLVGVVTHIRDLADRMPVRLEVSKGTTTSTVVRVEA